MISNLLLYTSVVRLQFLMVAFVPSMSVPENFRLIFLIQAKGVRSYSIFKEDFRIEEKEFKEFSFVVILSIKLH